MSEHTTHLTKADLIYRFDKQIEEVKAKGETSSGHGEAFEGKWVDDELIIWDNHFAWENKLHAKLSFIEAEGGSIVKITYKDREGVWFKVTLSAIMIALILWNMPTVELNIAPLCIIAYTVYDLYQRDKRRQPVEEYVSKTIAA